MFNSNNFVTSATSRGMCSTERLRSYDRLVLHKFVHDDDDDDYIIVK